MQDSLPPAGGLSHDAIRTAVSAWAAAESLVRRIYLFGSRARGDHDPDSDWDLCVLLDDDIAPGVFTPSALWKAVRDVALSIQVTPMRRSVFETGRADINALAHDVAQDGILLFDRALSAAP